MRWLAKKQLLISLRNRRVDGFLNLGADLQSREYSVSSLKPLLNPLCPETLKQKILELAESLPPRTLRIDLPVSVIVPDPLVRDDILDFIDFPDNTDQADMLVTARLAREYNTGPGARVCRYQILRREAKRIAVLVSSMATSLRESIEHAASSAQISFARLESYSSYLSRMPHRSGFSKPHATLNLTEESWLLECCSTEPFCFLADSDWAADLTADCERIIRLIRTFSNRMESDELTLFISGRTPLAELVQKHEYGAGMTFRPLADFGSIWKHDAN